MVLGLKKKSKLKMRKKGQKFKDSKKAHAYLQTILKAYVEFQKDWHKTVGGVERTRCILPIHFSSIKAL